MPTLLPTLSAVASSSSSTSQILLSLRSFFTIRIAVLRCCHCCFCYSSCSCCYCFSSLKQCFKARNGGLYSSQLRPASFSVLVSLCQCRPLLGAQSQLGVGEEMRHCPFKLGPRVLAKHGARDART